MSPARHSYRAWRPAMLIVAFLVTSLWSIRLLSPEGAAAATPILVNSFSDEKVNDEFCTLREAIIAANKDNSQEGCLAGSGADTILLPPGVYTLTRQNSGSEDASTTGDLDIREDLTIQPTGPGLVVIDGGTTASRVLEIEGGEVTLQNLTIRNGRDARGAGIYVNKNVDLSLINVTLAANEATDQGGALYVENSAAVHLTNVTIAGNVAGSGAAIKNDGAVVMVNTIVGLNGSPGTLACSGDDLEGAGPNLVADSSCATANTVVAANPGITAQTDGGGITFWTLTEGSPAVDTGDDGVCPDVDQLGAPRPQRDHCDMGAHELPQHPPVAAPLSITTAEDTPVSITLSGSDADGDALTFQIVQPPAIGSLGPVTPQTDTTATLLYTPPLNFFGLVTFTYVVGDGLVLSAPATVTLTVTPDANLEVTSIADSGPGSLRSVLLQANADPDLSTIIFDLPGAGPHVILLDSALPAVQYPVFIDGTTQPQGQVIVDGQGGDFPGLLLLSGAGGSTVKGLVFRNFGSHGIVLQQSGGNVITGNTVTGNGGDGIAIIGDPNDTTGTGGNTITGNTITGNHGAGVSITDSIQNDLADNDITGNDGLALDLGNDGRTGNDPLDEDDGANLTQNYPVIFRAVPDTVAAAADVTDATSLVISGRLNSTPNQTFTIRVYVSASCGSGDQTLIPTLPATVTTGDDGNVYFTLTTGEPVALDQGLRVTATDASGNTSEYSDCIISAYPNDSWPNALPLDVSNGPAAVHQYLDLFGQARWYRFSVQPHSRLEILLTDLPANYDLTLYKDLFAAYQELLQPQDVNQLSAEFAPAAFSPSAFSPAAFSPSAFSPAAFSPAAFSPAAFSPAAFSPAAFSPSAFSPAAFSPSAFSPSAFSPAAFSPAAFSPAAFSPAAFSPAAFSPAAFSSAQTRSLIGVSAFDGTAGEGLAINTWNNTGDFYIRVRGREGAFSLDAPFQLQVTLEPGPCRDMPADSTLPATSLAAVADDYKTIILVDRARLAARFAQTDVDALLAQLGVLAARPEVKGIIVNVNDDARVAAANARADTFITCPYAKNVVAESIRSLVRTYDGLNPLEYVVIAGDDDTIPFFRYPDNALLGSETNYVPPVRDETASQASLRLGYVLSQDGYGAAMDLSQNATEFPVPKLAVGRLVETIGDMQTLLDAYLATTGGVAPAPQSAFVTGYDFLEDAALAVQSELAAGLNAPVDALITPQSVSPLDPSAWTADQLRAALSGQRYDIAFLAGHFNAASALAADYRTSFYSSELLALPPDLTNALFFSAGCHSGYNIVTPHGVAGITFEPDWAQAFAQRGATLVAGTGYQYGDTEFIEYSERLYLEFTRKLRTGEGPVPVGKALVAAKQRYLATTPVMRGIHEKAVLEATLFGLPMFAVDMPGARLPADDDAPVVQGTQAVTVAPGSVLGLRFADLTITPQLTERILELSNVDGGAAVEARWLEGSDGVVTNPAEPALPLESMVVSVPGQALRGVGLRGGAYSDEAGILPLTGAPTTELRGVHSPFQSGVWFPLRPWGVNYFGALIPAYAGTGDITRFNVTPAQHMSSSAGELTGLRRQFSRLDFRLFYTAVDGVAAAGGDQVSEEQHQFADLPSIIQTFAVQDGADVVFNVRVVGNPSAGLQNVWVTYTARQGPWFGLWQSLDLTQNSGDSTLWEGRLPLGATAVTDIRFISQAVNGYGLVAMADNLGRYYTPGIDANRLPATLELLPLATTAAPFGDQVALAAILRDAQGSPLANLPLTFGVGTQERLGLTGADGRAQVNFPLLGLPGQYLVTVAFGGSDEYAATADTGDDFFTIVRQTTALTIDPPSAQGEPTTPGLVTATLMDGAGRRLVEQTVFFRLQGDQDFTQPVITNLIGQATLGTASLPPGAYTVVARYNGVASHEPALSASGQLLLELTEPTAEAPSAQPGRAQIFLPVMQRP